jgi:hypothetical protein
MIPYLNLYSRSRMKFQLLYCTVPTYLPTYKHSNLSGPQRSRDKPIQIITITTSHAIAHVLAKMVRVPSQWLQHNYSSKPLLILYFLLFLKPCFSFSHLRCPPFLSTFFWLQPSAFLFIVDGCSCYSSKCVSQ